MLKPFPRTMQILKLRDFATGLTELHYEVNVTVKGGVSSTFAERQPPAIGLGTRNLPASSDEANVVKCLHAHLHSTPVALKWREGEEKVLDALTNPIRKR
jgi:hypothetical protein